MAFDWHTQPKPRVVFVVDNEVEIADIISEILRKAGFQVTTFYDGSEVLSSTPKCPPDVVVTDYAMPKVNGLALTAWVEEHWPRCRIVMISGNPGAIPAAALDRGPKFTLLAKPVPPTVLIAIVKGASPNT
jgi:DNA-binding NtrC family response regulator